MEISYWHKLFTIFLPQTILVNIIGTIIDLSILMNISPGNLITKTVVGEAPLDWVPMRIPIIATMK